MELHTYIYIPIINHRTQHLFITIHNQLHVLAMLSHPQAEYNYIKRECTTVNIALLKSRSQFLSHHLYSYIKKLKENIKKNYNKPTLPIMF
jgi:hypothetical protein